MAEKYLVNVTWLVVSYLCVSSFGVVVLGCVCIPHASTQLLIIMDELSRI